MKAGLEACCKGDLAIIHGGGGEDHRIGGGIMSVGNRTLDVAGEDSPCLMGKLLLRMGSRGSVSAVSMVKDWREEDGEDMKVAGQGPGKFVLEEEPPSMRSYTVLALSGPWVFDRCRIESSSGEFGGESALVAAEASVVSLNATHVGGQGEGDARADVGLSACDSAQVSLHACGISLCSRFGAKAHDRSRIHISGGAIERCRVCLSLSEDADVRLVEARVGGHDAAFTVDDMSRFTAKLFLTKTSASLPSSLPSSPPPSFLPCVPPSFHVHPSSLCVCLPDAKIRKFHSFGCWFLSEPTLVSGRAERCRGRDGSTGLLPARCRQIRQSRRASRKTSGRTRTRLRR